MDSTHFQNLDGVGSWMYNYNPMPLSNDELDFINRNSLDFMMMLNGAYIQLESQNSITGWPLAQGTNRRCFLWESALPTNVNNQYYGSPLCTADDLIRVVNATRQVVNTPITKLAMFNEPWPEAAYPENATLSARAYKDIFEPTADAFGLKIISATTQATSRALEWDIEFFERCIDIGCNLELLDGWSVHRYNVKLQPWIDQYSLPDGAFYTQRINHFSSGYGDKSASWFQNFFRRQPLYVTEFNAEQETGTSYGPPDNSGTCLRLTGQFGNFSNCNGEPRCDWGIGGLNWMLAEEQTHVAGVVIWPTRHGETQGNQEGGRSGRLVFEDGSLTPTGRAFIAAPDNGWSVDCNDVMPPSPPPPA